MARKVIVSPVSPPEVKWAFIVSLTEHLRSFTYRYSFGGGIQLQTTVGPNIHVGVDDLIPTPSFVNIEMRLKWKKPTKLAKYGKRKTTETLAELSSSQLELFRGGGTGAVLHVGQIEEYFLDLLTILRGLDSGERFDPKTSAEVSSKSYPGDKLRLIFSCLDAFDGNCEQLEQVVGAPIRFQWEGYGIEHPIGRRFRFVGKQRTYLTDIIIGTIDGVTFCKRLDHPMTSRRLIVKARVSGSKEPLDFNIGMNFVISGLVNRPEK